MISLSGVSKTVGARTLFSDVSLQLLPGRRLALVGGNGTGKTTLLELVAGGQRPDDGTVDRARDVDVGLLPQEIELEPGHTVLAEVLRGAHRIRAAEQELRRLEQALASDHPSSEHESLLAAYGQAQDRFQTLGGFEIEPEAHRILAGLGFAPEDAQRDVSELSGGWRMRTALARLLLQRPDVLLLDEPTNHLDITSIDWLEGTLRGWDGAVLIVSHDRDFIDGVATHVAELRAGTLTVYTGGFAEFVVQRDERIEQQRAAAANQERRITQTEEFIERFRYKASKAKQVQSRIKSLEKVERIEVDDAEHHVLKLAIPEPPRSGRVTVELDAVTFGYDGRAVIKDADLVLERGQKVALLGPNGAGKTTLLRLLAGQLYPDAGALTLGHNVEVAYFAQHQVEALDLDRTVLQNFADGLGERHRDKNLRTILGAFGFSGDHVHEPTRVLSGGEKTRLALAKLVADPAALLLLDEPTNHLDIASRDVLEDALEAYHGTVVLVTHDRHLIRNVADTIVTVENGRIGVHAGSFDDYLRGVHGTLPQADGVAGVAESSRDESAGSSRQDRDARKRREAELRNALHRATKDLRARVDRVEQQLARVEGEVAELTRKLADPAVYEDEDRARELVLAHGAAKDQASQLMAEWEEAQLELEEATERVESEMTGA